MSTTSLPMSTIRDLDTDRHPRIAARIRESRADARRMRREADRLRAQGRHDEAESAESAAYDLDCDADAMLERFV